MGTTGNSQGVFLSNSHSSILSVTQQLWGTDWPSEPPVPDLLLHLNLPFHVGPPSPSFPAPHPSYKARVPSRSHLPLPCFRLLANASQATLHRFPCCYLLRLSYTFLSILRGSCGFQKDALGYWFSQGPLAIFPTKPCLIKEHHIDLIKKSNSQNPSSSLPPWMGLSLDGVRRGGFPRRPVIYCYCLPSPPGGRAGEAAGVCTLCGPCPLPAPGCCKPGSLQWGPLAPSPAASENPAGAQRQTHRLGGFHNSQCSSTTRHPPHAPPLRHFFF